MLRKKRKEGPLKCSPSLLLFLDLDSDRPCLKPGRNYIRKITFIAASFLVIPVDRPGVISVLTNVCSTNTTFHKLISLCTVYIQTGLKSSNTGCHKKKRELQLISNSPFSLLLSHRSAFDLLLQFFKSQLLPVCTSEYS